MRREKIKNRFGENLTRYEFDNGFEVLAIEKPQFMKQFAGILVDYGGVDGDLAANILPGMAHFLEHKLFAKKNGDITQVFEQLGASSNAFTSYNETMYYANYSDRQIDSIKTLFKLVSKPYFTAQNVATERSIILQELGMYQDDPYWQLSHQLMSQLYPNNFLKNDIVGNQTSLQKITAKNLLHAYQQAYRAGSMKLVVSGPDDFSQQIEDIQAAILALPTGKSQLKQNFDTQKINANTITINGDVSVPKFAIGIKLENFKDFTISQDLAQLIIELVLESILGTMSVTYERLRAKNLLSNELQIGMTYTRQGNFVTVYGQSQKPHEVIANLLAAINQAQVDLKTLALEQKIVIGKSLRILDDVENYAIETIESSFERDDLLTTFTKLTQLSPSEILTYFERLFGKHQMTSTILISGESK